MDRRAFILRSVAVVVAPALPTTPVAAAVTEVVSVELAYTPWQLKTPDEVRADIRACITAMAAAAGVPERYLLGEVPEYRL